MIHVNDSIGIWDLYAPAYERIRCLDGAGRPVGDGGGHVSPEVHVSVTAQAESSVSTVVQSKTASPEIAVAPSLTPTFRDPHAPNPQKCPGYKATNIKRDLKALYVPSRTT
ncbi:hypothetical protein FOXB_07934 [Fusarium oxysporum f. sp. conglutinans Fo5176]|uniref:Uncharacterized protein n=1 Tax=Fusarium oxysporum (strain Fo5176) TaxID=660025 RepID=F9FNF4_FUSOF|nr:hypothetical protein FOXB_07934 [Fusarium oxysporum f. sp. conglutinans Fo5176]